MSLDVGGLRALAHPVRLRILSLLTGTSLSAAEIARELGITHANASYHLRQLAAAGQLVEAGEERIRGGVAKRYRHPWRSAGSQDPADEQDRVLYLKALTSELMRRFPLRVPGAAEVTDAELWVDRAVWEEVRDLVSRATTLLHDQARAPRTDGTVHVNLTAAVFEIREQDQ